jgi:hypothetical protein
MDVSDLEISMMFPVPIGTGNIIEYARLPCYV